MKRTRFCFLLLVLVNFSMNAQERFDFSNNPIPFFNLNITDSYEVVGEKLRGQNYEVIIHEVEEDWYLRQITEKFRKERIFVMWPDNQILEEGMNMNFLLRHIGGRIASFTKFSIPKSEFDSLVEIFTRRDDCIITEDNLFINYEITMDSLSFALQYNSRNGLGTFSYSNSDYFVPREVWEREEEIEVWEGYIEDVKNITDNEDAENQMAVQNDAKTSAMPLWVWFAIGGAVAVGVAVVFIVRRKKVFLFLLLACFERNVFAEVNDIWGAWNTEDREIIRVIETGDGFFYCPV